MTDQFDDYKWHDNAIHAFRIVEGPDHCSGELILDIDFIVEWLAPTSSESTFSFQVAPADLVFHQVTDLVISLDYAACSAALQPMTIDKIGRKVLTYPTGYSSFAWTIEMNWPDNSRITFCAPGYTQTLRAAPIRSPAQSLEPSQRSG